MSKQRWTIDKFLPLYLQAAEEGITKEEFASQLGIKPDTVYQRVYALRRSGHEIPLLRASGKIPVAEQASKIIADFKARKTGPSSPKVEDINHQLDEASAGEGESVETVLGLN